MKHAYAWWLAALLAAGGCKEQGGEQSKEGAAKPAAEATQEAAKPAAAEPAAEPEAAPEDATAAAPTGPTLAERLAPPEDVAKPPADAPVTKSGIASRVLQEGTGDAKPGDHDTAIVNYTAWTNDGKVKDSTWKRGEPRTMKLHKTMSGWAEAVQLMKVGEHRRVWIPIDKALKSADAKGTLCVDLVLETLYPAPPAPPDVARPPKDATRRPSGLAWKALTDAPGGEHPKPTNTVSVRYAGWTTDGVCFDRTLGDELATFDLASVIPGWTEGIPLLAKGQKGRLWIPEKIAYAGKSGKPKGMLVFDVELVSFE